MNGDIENKGIYTVFLHRKMRCYAMGNMLRVDCLCRVSTVRNVRTSVRGSGQQSMSRHEKSRLAQASLLLSCVDKKDVHSRVFQRSSQAAKPQKAGSDQSRGEGACKRTGGGSAALRREGEAKQTLLQRGRSVIKGFVKIQ